MSAVSPRHHATGEQQSPNLFNGIESQALVLLRQSQPPTSTTSDIDGRSLNEQYVHLRQQHRALLASLEPDLVVVYQVNARLAEIEEQMRLQRCLRH